MRVFVGRNRVRTSNIPMFLLHVQTLVLRRLWDRKNQHGEKEYDAVTLYNMVIDNKWVWSNWHELEAWLPLPEVSRLWTEVIVCDFVTIQ